MFEKTGLTNIKLFAKGRRSLVYTAIYKKKKVAIKVVKSDIKMIRERVIENEVNWLKKLNKFNIGPKFIKNNKKYFIYEFVEGERFVDWFKKSNKKDIIKVLRKIFSQLRIMDELKVDKKEMHNPIKHILVSNKVVMIDFERCHNVKDPKNVTQFCQFLMSDKIFKKMWKFDKQRLIDLLKIYKKDQSQKNYKNILNLLF